LEAKRCPTEGQFAIREEEMCSAYLLELLDGTLVDSTALVDQVACMYCEKVFDEWIRG